MRKISRQDFGPTSLACLSLVSAAFFLIAQAAHAGSATWNLNPTSGDWNTGSNWTPASYPNGPDDVATFDVSQITDVSLSESVEVNSIVFNPGASAFTITAGTGKVNNLLTISGAGVINNSSVTQNFVTAGANANISFKGELERRQPDRLHHSRSEPLRSEWCHVCRFFKRGKRNLYQQCWN